MYEENQCYDIIKDVFFSGKVENGFCWNHLTKERMKDPKALELYGYKVYSQNDEDGIIHEIFKRIGTTNKKFIEFGVQDGLESNCHLLLHYGWKGLWLEGSEKYCKVIATKFKPVIDEGILTVKRAFITKENINQLISQSGFEGEIDLLSIDIDGNDYYVWDSINAVNPRVIIIEYNGKFPPDLEWKQAYNASHVWDGSDWQGASLKSLELLGRKKGYRLVGTNLSGCNAFFVRADVAKDHFIDFDTAEMLYNPLRLNLNFIANHPSKYCLAVQKDDLGLLNYQDYELCSGFYDIELSNDRVHAWTNSLESIIKIRIPKGTSTISIPVSAPQNIVETNGFGANISSVQKDLFNHIEYKNNSFVLSLSPHEYDFAAELIIHTAYLWSPSDVLKSNDTRLLGIDISLSEIKYLC